MFEMLHVIMTRQNVRTAAQSPISVTVSLGEYFTRHWLTRMQIQVIDRRSNEYNIHINDYSTFGRVECPSFIVIEVRVATPVIARKERMRQNRTCA